MSHQDWKEVILRNPKAAKPSSNLQKETVKRSSGTVQKEVDIAEGKEIKYVSPKLKKAVLDARTNLIDLSTDKCYTRDSFAKRINVPVKEIKLLETGKMTEKEAKQIALKIERVFKIKILGK